MPTALKVSYQHWRLSAIMLKQLVSRGPGPISQLDYRSVLVLCYLGILFAILVALKPRAEAQDMTKNLRHVALYPD